MGGVCSETMIMKKIRVRVDTRSPHSLQTLVESSTHAVNNTSHGHQGRSFFSAVIVQLKRFDNAYQG